MQTPLAPQQYVIQVSDEMYWTIHYFDLLDYHRLPFENVNIWMLGMETCPKLYKGFR